MSVESVLVIQSLVDTVGKLVREITLPDFYSVFLRHNVCITTKPFPQYVSFMYLNTTSSIYREMNNYLMDAYSRYSHVFQEIQAIVLRHKVDALNTLLASFVVKTHTRTSPVVYSMDVPVSMPHLILSWTLFKMLAVRANIAPPPFSFAASGMSKSHSNFSHRSPSPVGSPTLYLLPDSLRTLSDYALITQPNPRSFANVVLYREDPLPFTPTVRLVDYLTESDPVGQLEDLLPRIEIYTLIAAAREDFQTENPSVSSASYVANVEKMLGFYTLPFVAVF